MILLIGYLAVLVGCSVHLYFTALFHLFPSPIDMFADFPRSRVVQEVSANMAEDLLAAAITVGWMGTGFVIAKLMTGGIGATAVEKWAI